MSTHSLLPDPGSFLAGGFSGACGVLVAQPFDIIKVRLQNSGGNDFIVFKNLIKYEGILSLWRGCGVSIFGRGVGNAISFGVVENAKSRMMKNRTEPLSAYEHALCGAYSGVACSFVITPAECIRIRLQTQVRGVGIYKNSKELILEALRKGGLSSLYKGFLLTLVRDVFGDSAYFAAYQMVPRVLFGGEKNTEHRDYWVIMFAGGMAGIAFWTVAYPIDTIKSRLQADSIHKPQFRGGLDCFLKTVRNEGVIQLYRGYFMCILRAFPLNVSLVLGFEFAMKYVGRDY